MMPSDSGRVWRLFVVCQLFATWVACGSGAAWAAAPKIVASPHDDHHLIVVRSSELVDEKAKPAALVEDTRGSFGMKTAPVTAPLAGDVRVRHAGKYELWVRVSQPTGKRSPLAVELRAGEKKLVAGTIGGDAGAAGRGGPAGYAAYQAIAKINTPKGAVASLETKRFEVEADEGKNSGKAGGKDAAKPATDDLADDLLGELREKPADPWAHLARLDELSDTQPSYWWKVGVVELEPGVAQFRIAPAGAAPKKPTDVPRFDAAMLTTFDKLSYPYAGDIDEVRATFVRFRLDKLPKQGVRLGGDFQTHVLQHPVISTRFGREVIDKDDLFTKTGLTCWYRLQDLKWMPLATQHEIGVRISVNGAAGINVPAEGFAGATQFASFPHPDYIVREFDWSEPTGLNYTCALDVENYAHRLMTFRDHAREHYRTALAAAGGKISPLVRGELYFTTIAGSLGPDDRDYMLKTMRLLGINSLCEGGANATEGRKLFGWNNAFFAATMPMGDLFDADKARATYDEYFKPMFDVDPEQWKDTWSFCYMDEPGELYREQMTGPFWQYIDDGDAPYWFDPVGDSALHIKHTELPDCVLEGVVERVGTIEFRVGLSDLKQPQKYYLWALGNAMGPAINSNLAHGPYIEGAKTPSIGYRYVPALGTNLGKLKFKIVYQQGVATLFINDRTIHQLVNLPETPSFGIAGGSKKIYALRLRPLKPGEGVKIEEGAGDDSAGEALGDAVLEELELDDPPAWAKPKSLRDFAEQDCIYAGGVPGVAEALVAYLKEQKLDPKFFGKKSWDEIRPLTMAQLVTSEDDARLYYWSRRFSSQLTPRNFGLISEAIHRHAPNPKMWSYAALSGGVIYRARQMPLDMFHVGGLGNTATGGISDWMFYSSWRWDSHQIVGYSAEIYNTGARRHGERPVSFPMMHCVAPSTFRAFTQLGAQVKLMSLYAYGPHYLNYPDSWAQSASCYEACARLAARSAPADDILAPGLRRPSRVALLYPHSSEYWSTDDGFDDRRGTWLALSHEYYQPELVTEQQIEDGALKHYDALYVVDRHVAGAVQKQIGKWLDAGGLLWTCADALTRDEYDQPADLLKPLGIERTWAKDAYAEAMTLPGAPPKFGPRVKATTKQPAFREHAVAARGLPATIKLGKEFGIRAQYADGKPAWGERAVGKGRVVYVGHRAGSTYTSKNILVDGHRELWADTGRELLALPLKDQKITRELSLSETAIMASPISSPAGTGIVLYNMRPSPRKELKLSLREPKKPLSVSHIEGNLVVDLPCEFKDGMATITLPTLDEEDIVYVRREAADDDRLAVMRKRTEQQLQATDPQELSAGAWVAGFYPDWKLIDRVTALVEHDDWRVRRAAAETIGRLKSANAGNAVAKQLEEETDPHVIAEQIETLAAMGYPRLGEACSERLKDARFVVREAALAALADRVLSDDADNQSAEASEGLQVVARKAALAALADSDQRVRQQAIRIVARFEPKLAAARTLAAFADRDPVAVLDRPLWAKALGEEESGWKSLAADAKSMDLPLLIAVGQHRRDKELASQLVKQADAVTPEQAHAFSLAMIQQRDPAAARELLANRAKLPPRVVYYLPIILEHTFETGLGNVLEDWDAKLAK